MIGIRGGNTDGTVQIRKLVVLGVGLRLLNAAFHFADRLEVLGKSGTIARTEIAFESAEIFGEGVEQAGPFLERSAAFGEVASVAKEALEDDARVRFSRQRGRGRRPGEIVLISAGVAVVALTDHLEVVHGQFEGGQLGSLSNTLSRDLIDRRSQVVVGALRQLGFGGTQEGRVGGSVAAGVGVLQF